MNATTWVALFGIVGTLAGGLGGHYLQARLKEQADRRAKLNEQQLALYLEVMTFAQVRDALLDRMQDPHYADRDIPEASKAGAISAKIALFAPETVQNDWKHLLKTIDDLNWHLNEVEPELNFRTEVGLPDFAELTAVRDAITMLRRSLREAMGAPAE